jgi:hypothetical protein
MAHHRLSWWRGMRRADWRAAAKLRPPELSTYRRTTDPAPQITEATRPRCRLARRHTVATSLPRSRNRRGTSDSLRSAREVRAPLIDPAVAPAYNAQKNPRSQRPIALGSLLFTHMQASLD